jgi:SAM-dependent methyltransferase/uncharacterized protein YbaR (Trm112 family)
VSAGEFGSARQTSFEPFVYAGRQYLNPSAFGPFAGHLGETMWLRFFDALHCPSCKGPLELKAFKQNSRQIEPRFEDLARAHGLYDERFGEYVESGLLLCNACKAKFPILDGLPVLLCYTTPAHAHFGTRHASELGAYEAYQFLEKEPASGEREVMASFSREWLDYDYDGVIWEMHYEDHERRFLREVGALSRSEQPRRFLEVGCGLGITTHLAQKNFGVDAVGLDLSLAVWKACRHYRENPFLHFVQASVFSMPFARESFDLIYSRGVLHHTASTESAFQAVAALCRKGGTFYLWVYGPGSISETVFRRLVYGLERIFRPALSANPESVPAKAFLTVMGAGYVLFNRLRRASNPAIQPLTLARGVHAARDRFTPRFAHRHPADEVTSWFSRAGFKNVEIVDWKSMPPADHDDYRRNVGVRGTLASEQAG